VVVVSVFEQQGFVAGAEDSLGAPLAKRGHHRPQGVSFVGEEVVVAGAAGVIGPPFEDAGVDEPVESGREDVAANP
jgi:hypothetical protein